MGTQRTFDCDDIVVGIGIGGMGFNGESFGAPNLFAAAGPTLPANLGATTRLTVTVLSEYIMALRPSKKLFVVQTD